MLSSPLRMSVISPSSAPKDNGTNTMNSAAVPSSHESKTKTLSNRMVSLEADIHNVEAKIAKLMKRRDERTKQSTATNAAALLINHNNNINKSSVIHMGADGNPSLTALHPSHPLGNVLKTEFNPDDCNWSTDVKPPQCTENSSSLLPTSADALRVVQLSQFEVEQAQFSCTCLTVPPSGRETPLCQNKEGCSRVANVGLFIETNEKLTSNDLIYKIYNHNKVRLKSYWKLIP